MQDVITPTALENITRGEIDIAIATAKKYPRSVQTFRQKAMTMATSDAETAASCFYKLSRGGSLIEGPSVRLAEIVASAWGNLRFGARIVAEDDKFVTAQGVAHDLEANVQMTTEIRRRISGRDGKKYSDDMISVTCNAACAIALRNAIFKTVPFTYAKQIFEQAKKTAVGDVKTMGERRKGMVDSFGKMGVSLDQILALVQKPSIEDVGLAEIELLIGVFNAIKDGDTTIEEQFPPAPKVVKAEVNGATVAAADPAPAAPEEKKQTPLQVFFALDAQVKKLFGKDASRDLMGPHANTFPSKLTEDVIHELIAAFQEKLTPKQEVANAAPNQPQ